MDPGFFPGLPQTPSHSRFIPPAQSHGPEPYTPLLGQQQQLHYYSPYAPVVPPGHFPMYQIPFNAPTQSSSTSFLPPGRLLQPVFNESAATQKRPVIANEPLATQKQPMTVPEPVASRTQTTQPDDSTDNERIAGTQKRRTRGGGNTQRARRRRLDENGLPTSGPANAASTTVSSSTLASTPTPTVPSNPIPTTDTCGVGLIQDHTRRSASPSKNPVFNSKIFRSKLKRDSKRSSHVATDVWFNLHPCEKKEKPPTPLQSDNDTIIKKRPHVNDAPFLACRFCIEHGKWHAWKNTNGQTETMRDHMQNEHWAEYCQSVLSERLKGWESIQKDFCNSGPSTHCNHVTPVI
ncbi:hypothetical protein F5878DRAFT_655833 [Lentinula raphanica]|uniref:Uncharacterized protein n=1 Tax=Lentinula raphanica TaxID=153919 RepID=A0AA38PKE2_9AGAR|nr:hypothetical protein F5878DRAFT_655833 [Lentinula raphanica]